MLDGLAAQNTIYSCNGVPVELTDDADLKFNEQKVMALNHRAQS